MHKTCFDFIKAEIVVLLVCLGGPVVVLCVQKRFLLNTNYDAKTKLLRIFSTPGLRYVLDAVKN